MSILMYYMVFKFIQREHKDIYTRDGLIHFYFSFLLSFYFISSPGTSLEVFRITANQINHVQFASRKRVQCSNNICNHTLRLYLNNGAHFSCLPDSNLVFSDVQCDGWGQSSLAYVCLSTERSRIKQIIPRFTTLPTISPWCSPSIFQRRPVPHYAAKGLASASLWTPNRSTGCFPGRAKITSGAASLPKLQSTDKRLDC